MIDDNDMDSHQDVIKIINHFFHYYLYESHKMFYFVYIALQRLNTFLSHSKME